MITIFLIISTIIAVSLHCFPCIKFLAGNFAISVNIYCIECIIKFRIFSINGMRFIIGCNTVFTGNFLK